MKHTLFRVIFLGTALLGIDLRYWLPYRYLRYFLPYLKTIFCLFWCLFTIGGLGGVAGPWIYFFRNPFMAYMANALADFSDHTHCCYLLTYLIFTRRH